MSSPCLSRAELLRLRRAGLIKPTAESVRPPADVLRAELEDLVADFNAEDDPMSRAVLHGKIQSVRRLLGIGASTTFSQRETRHAIH